MNKYKGPFEQKELFYGTHEHTPEQIYEGIDESFDRRLAQKGLWGSGIYFSESSLYSDGQAYVKADGTRQMLIALVNIGHSVDQPQGNHLRPPQQPNSSMRYDSIHAFTENANIYIIYENSQAYPIYLITYKKL